MTCLLRPCEFSEYMAKERNEIMPGNQELAGMHIKKHDRTFHIHMSYAYRTQKGEYIKRVRN